jgi:hypothetical protein
MRQEPGTAIVEELDQFITPAERRRWSVWYVVCDDDGRARTVCPVQEVPPEPRPEVCVRISDVFAEAIQTLGVEASLLVLITRPGSASVVASDRLWYKAARQVCAERRVPLLGVHLVTATGHREIFLDDVL